MTALAETPCEPPFARTTGNAVDGHQCDSSDPEWIRQCDRANSRAPRPTEQPQNRGPEELATIIARCPSPQARGLARMRSSSAIGAGAMGEVYRARDARLNRHVAVKVLPSEFTRDSDRVCALHAGSQGRRGAQPSRRRRGLRRRRRRRRALRGVGAARRRDAARVRGVARARCRRKKADRSRGADRQRHGGRASQGHRPSRSEAGEHLRHQRRPREDPRLRPRQADRVRRARFSRRAATMAMTSPGMVHGDRRLHVARAGARRARRPPQRHLRVRRRLLRDALPDAARFPARSAVETMHAMLQHDPPELPAGAIAPPLERIARRCLEKNPTHASSRPAISRSRSRRCRRLASRAGCGSRRGAQQARGRTAIGMAVAMAAAARRRRRARSRLDAATARPAPAGVMSFEARTFDRLPITNARFMPDGQTIVYSAAARGYLPPDLFVINPNAEAPQPLGVTQAHLLSVSTQGRAGDHRQRPTARAAPLHRHARAHDDRQLAARRSWKTCARPTGRPTATALAIVHDLGNGRDRLEYPAGTALHEVERLPERSARLAGRRARRLLRASVALRRSRLGEGRRSRRQGDDADRRAVGIAGTGLVARRLDASSSPATRPAGR